MNGFRLTGDLIHLLAIIILLWKILKTRSCAGISGRSQILLAAVYITRYTDLFTNFVSVYNTVMKIFFVSTSLVTLYLIYFKFKATYSQNDSISHAFVGSSSAPFNLMSFKPSDDRNPDTFRTEFLVIPAAILALVINHEFTKLELLWTFSIYLESVAILPQFYMILKTGEVETLLSYYIICLGSYRSFYILNWIHRYYVEQFYDLIAITAGILQTVLYGGFLYLYTSNGTKRMQMKLEDEKQRMMEEGKLMMLKKEKQKMLEGKEVMLENEKQVMLEWKQVMLEKEKQVMLEKEKQVMLEEGKQVMLEEGKQVLSEEGKQVISEEGKQVMSEAGKRVTSEEVKQVMLEEGKQVMLKEGKQVMLEEGKQVMLEEGKQVMLEEGKHVMLEEGKHVMLEDRKQVIAEERKQVIAEEEKLILEEEKQLQLPA